MNDRTKQHLYISSPHNDRVKQWSSLLDKKYRDRTGQFIIEGVHLIIEALKAEAEVYAVIYDDERGIPAELAEAAAEGGRNIEWISAARPVMAKCTGTETAPPVFAVLRKLQTDHAALFKGDCLVIVLDGLRDPGNVGTIIRSADAAGADAVLLGKGSVDLYNPKTVRSTMGSLFHLPVLDGELGDLLEQAKSRGIKLVGTSLQASYNCYSYDWTGPTWLVMGNESEGLSPAVRAALDDTVIIPMPGEAESLNVAMASTVLLFEALRQRRFGEGTNK